MYRTLLGIVGTLAVLFLLVGLSFSSSLEKPADFRFVNGSEPASLDPHLVTDQVSNRIVSGLFEGLTRKRASDLSPAPGVAERWDVSEDQKRYTFFLRKNAVWSDGVPLTAKDFVYSWLRVLDPSLGAEYAYLLHRVRYAEAYNTFDGLADTLEHDVKPALVAFREQHPGAVAAALWQRFLAENQLHTAFKHSQNERALTLLHKQQGEILPADFDAFEADLHKLAGELREQARMARAHLGVDAGIFAVDDHTLVVELDAPTPYFLDITSYYTAAPVPRHVVEAHPHDWFLPEHMVSNGPYRLAAWRVNDRIRLVRSDNYWGKSEVRSEIVEALPVENTTTALNLYLTGQVDWIPDAYPKDLAQQLAPRPDFYRNPGLVVYFYRLNTTRPPFNDVRVREAFNLAIDRKLITDKVLGLGQLPAYGFVPPGLAHYVPPSSHIRLDVARAQQLLAEAGYPGGRGFPKVGLVYNTNDQHKKLAEVVADELRRNLSVEITPYNQEWQSFLVTCRAKDYDMARAGWNGDYLDANTFLDMWVTNGGNNQTGFSSAKYDALINASANIDEYLAAPPAVLSELKDQNALEQLREQLAAASSVADRVAIKTKIRLQLQQEAEAILVQDEFPVVPLYFYVVSGLVRSDVRGFYSQLVPEGGSSIPNLLDEHPLRDIWRDSSQAAGDPGATR